MEGLLHGKHFIVSVVLLITLNSSCVLSFSTQSCTHEQIETHLKTTLNCVMKSQNRNMKSFLAMDNAQIAKLKEHSTNTTEWCELIDEEIECFTKNLGTCFNKKLTSDFAILMEWYYNKQPYMECNRLEGDNKEEIERKGKAIIKNYKKDIESLKDIVTFDQECSTEELIMSVKGKWPCLMMHFYSIIQELMPHIIGPKPSEPKSIPVCKNVVGILNGCFTQTDCLSQPEMSLIRDFLATYYNVAMGFVVQLTAKFGSMSSFMDTIGVGKEDVHDIEGYPKLNTKMKTMMMKGMDMIVEDFKNDECQTSLKQFQMMVDEKHLVQNLPLTDDGPTPYVVIIALVLSMVAITVVALLGWVFYAYRNPTSSSGQFLIRSTAGKHRLFRSPSTSTV